MKTVYVIEFFDERFRESVLERFAFSSLEEATKELEKNNYEYSHRWNEIYIFTHKSDNRESATIIELEVI